MEKKKSGFKWSYVILLLLIVLLFVFVFVDNGNPGKEISLDQAMELITNDETKEQMDAFYAQDGVARIKLVGSEKKFPENSDYYFHYTDTTLEMFLKSLDEYNKSPDANRTITIINNPNTTPIWDIIMPILYIGFGLFLIFFVFKLLSNNNKGAMSFGKSRAKQTENIKVRFTDVAGMDEEKAELEEVVEFLKNPTKFTDLGARIPKGVLLVGNPGTGKTLLAKAVAGESNVPFLSISGSDFVEMFVGVGASRVRDLFEQAKKSRPCIVFIDEIDAVGRQRGTGLGGGNDEREQTLNQLLVEMDGFEPNDGIIVLAATNRSDVLDPALLRPGRFDRQVYVHLPDVKGREGILKIHAKNKPLADDVDFSTLARITSGFTGADIENMLNEAAILAARNNRPRILMSDVTEGINKVIMGPQKKSRLVTEEDRKITAYHESGHAILAKKLKHCEEVQEVSIIPRGMAAGYTMSRPDNDNQHITLNKLNDMIAMTMGGRVAEELIFKDITTGASNDIQKATEIARKMVTEWGMSKKLGFLNLGSEDQLFIGRDYQTKINFSEKTASEVDEEIRAILNYNYKRAKDILANNVELLDEMTKLLLEKETIYKDEVDMLMAGKSTSEIIAEMEEKEKVRKEREEVEKKDLERVRKLREYEKKLETGHMFLKNGIITIEDYNKIKKEYEDMVIELENEHIKEAKIEPEEPMNVKLKEETKEADAENKESKQTKPRVKKAPENASTIKKNSKKDDKKE